MGNIFNQHKALLVDDLEFIFLKKCIEMTFFLIAQFIEGKSILLLRVERWYDHQMYVYSLSIVIVLHSSDIKLHYRMLYSTGNY